MKMAKTPKDNLKTRFFNWCDRRGKHTLPRWYFSGLATLYLGQFFNFSFLLFASASIWVITKMFVEQGYDLSGYLLMFIIFLSTLVPNYILAKYLQKMTTYTFISKFEFRATILKRKKWKSVFQNLAIIFFTILVIFLVILLTLFISKAFQPSVLNSVNFEEIFSVVYSTVPTVFPVTFSFGIYFWLLKIFIDINMDKKTELAYITDTLVQIIEKDTCNNQLKNDEQYLFNEFIQKFGKLILSIRPNLRIQEIDLGKISVPLLLAMFFGDKKDRKAVKLSFNGLLQLFKEEEWKQKSLEWLNNLNVEFPKYVNIKDNVTMSLKTKRIFPRFYDCLKAVAVIATILGTALALFNFILGLIG